MTVLVAAIAVLSLGSPAQADSPVACTYDSEAVLALTPDEFDQGEETGWRPLAETPECRTAAAELIDLYRRTNWRSMTTNDVHSSYWHEGQLRAASGDHDRAVLLLMAGTNPNSIGNGEYELGTIAFLRGNLPGLLRARERLAALPPPDDWAEMRLAYEAAGVEPQWPPNLDILDGLIACFGRPYDEAYGRCAP